MVENNRITKYRQDSMRFNAFQIRSDTGLGSLELYLSLHPNLSSMIIDLVVLQLTFVEKTRYPMISPVHVVPSSGVLNLLEALFVSKIHFWHSWGLCRRRRVLCWDSS